MVIVLMGILVALEQMVSQQHVRDFVFEAFEQDEFCALCKKER